MPPRSPVIPWLLAAATLSVLVVVGTWVASEPFPTPPYAWAAYDAIITCLLSLVCYWSALRPRKTVWSRLAPAVAVPLAALVVAATVNDPVSFWDQAGAYFPGYGLHVALLLAGLWALQRTAFWRRRFASGREWRFSLAELLVTMTAVAVLAAALRHSPMFGENAPLIAGFVASEVALSFGSVLIWCAAAHPLLRLAGTMGLALAVGGVVGLISGFPPIFAQVIGVDFLLQALLLSLWLWGAPLLPPREPLAAEQPPATP